MTKIEDASSGNIDVGQIDVEDLETTGFPAALASEFRVVIDEAAYSTIRDHAVVDTTVELGGVLAGKLLKDDDGPFLLVKHAVRGIATKRTGSQVTFTHETWAKIHRDMEENFPDLQIVGWYHTHPGFGIFLSEMDEFIQDHFFNLPHQVAFVHDPLSGENGLFVWRDGRSVQLRRYWLAGRVHYDLETVAPAKAAVDSEAGDRQSTELPIEGHDEQSQPAAPPPAPQRMSLPGMLLAALVIMIAFWAGTKTTQLFSERSQEQTRALENLIRTGLFRDDLGRQLGNLSQELGRAQMVLMNAQNRPGVTQDDIDRRVLAEAADLLKEAHKRLAGISETFTQADRLARRMGRVSGMADDLRTVSRELQTQRVIVAVLCQSQAAVLEQGGGKEAMKMADELRILAARLLPSASAGGGVLDLSLRPIPAERSQ